MRNAPRDATTRAEVTARTKRAGGDETGEHLKQRLLNVIVSRPLNPREFVVLAAAVGLLVRTVLS